MTTKTKTKVLNTKVAKDMNTANIRVRRSEKLTNDERKAYKKKVESFDTKVDAALYFGFSIVTLDAVLLKGSGKPRTIETIRTKIAA